MPYEITIRYTAKDEDAARELYAFALESFCNNDNVQLLSSELDQKKNLAGKF